MDPTPRAQNHFDEFMSDKPYSGNVQSDYLENINGLTVDKSKFHYIAKGL